MTSVVNVGGLPLGNRLTRSPGWWAMVWTIATEAALFAFLLFAFYYVGSQTRNAWPPNGPLPLTLALPNTVLLVLSSFVYAWGERGIREGRPMRLRMGLLITFLMGLAFIIVQGLEWKGQHFSPSSHPFGALFYTITGFHGLHVIVGLLLNLAVQVWAWMGTFTRDRHLAVTNAGLYWHFVDVVWLCVFFSIYISPRLA